MGEGYKTFECGKGVREEREGEGGRGMSQGREHSPVIAPTRCWFGAPFWCGVCLYQAVLVLTCVEKVLACMSIYKFAFVAEKRKVKNLYCGIY